MSPDVKKLVLEHSNQSQECRLESVKGTGYHINYPIFANFRLFLFYTQDEAVCVQKLV